MSNNYLDGFGMRFLFEEEDNVDVLEKFMVEVGNQIENADEANIHKIIAKTIAKFLRDDLQEELEESVYEGIHALVNDSDEDESLDLSATEIDELANEVIDFICENPKYDVAEAINELLFE